jgi:hypothetical protein
MKGSETMNREFNANVGETIRRLTFTAGIIGAAFFAAAYASSAIAGPANVIAGATAPTISQTVGGTVQTVGSGKVISVRRARFINAEEGISPASCWVTYQNWGKVFYQTCPY